VEREHGVLITEFCDKLLKRFEMYEFAKLSESTVKEKKRHLEIFRNRFGTIRIKRISVLDINALLDEYVEDGKLSAAKTLRSYLSIFFKEAQYMGFVDSGFNPALSTRPIEAKVKRARITESDFSVFWENCQNGKSKHFIDSVKIAVTTGLRRSDIVNLKFSDVSDGYLHVSLGNAKSEDWRSGKPKLAIAIISRNMGQVWNQDRKWQDGANISRIALTVPLTQGRNLENDEKTRRKGLTTAAKARAMGIQRCSYYKEKKKYGEIINAITYVINRWEDQITESMDRRISGKSLKK
ncbi:phage integrase Arm DNA-binding domain-containing protein, partial [Aduncisulcus paluster]